MTHRLAALAACLLLPPLAGAHAHLEGAVPADGSIISAAPAELVLRFSEPARLTSLSMSRTGTPEPVKFGSLPTVTGAEIRLPAPALLPGSYELRYRVLSADGHIVSGTIHFAIASP